MELILRCGKITPAPLAVFAKDNISDIEQVLPGYDQILIISRL
ncbi:MAG: hypothetical protein WDM90_12540 [Ferruginibacter sp.]